MRKRGDKGRVHTGTVGADAGSASSSAVSSPGSPGLPIVKSGHSLVKSYGNPVFTSLMREISEDRAETALGLLAAIEDSLPSLGEALVLATECGLGKLVLALAQQPGATNRLPTALCILQQPMTARNPWKGTDARVDVYLALMAAFAKRENVQLDEKGKEDFTKALRHIISLESPLRISPLKALIENQTAIAGLDLNALLLFALKEWNGNAAEYLAKAGAPKLIQGIRWLQENNFIYERVVGTVLNPWKTGGRKETYSCFSAVLAGNKDLKLSEEEKNILITVLEFMIEHQEEEALVVLGSPEASVVLQLAEGKRSDLLHHAIKMANVLAVEKLVTLNKKDLCSILQYLLLERKNIEWKPGNYECVRSWLIRSLMPSGELEQEIISEDPQLIELLRTIVTTGEVEVLRQFLASKNVRARITSQNRITLFKAALEEGYTQLAVMLIENQPVVVQLEAISKMQVEFCVEGYELDSKGRKSISREFYVAQVKRILENSALFSGYNESLDDPSKAYLKRILEYLVTYREPVVISYLEALYLRPCFDHLAVFRAAAKAHNTEVFKFFTEKALKDSINVDCMVNVTEVLLANRLNNNTDWQAVYQRSIEFLVSISDKIVKCPGLKSTLLEIITAMLRMGDANNVILLVENLFLLKEESAKTFFVSKEEISNVINQAIFFNQLPVVIKLIQLQSITVWDVLLHVPKFSRETPNVEALYEALLSALGVSFFLSNDLSAPKPTDDHMIEALRNFLLQVAEFFPDETESTFKIFNKKLCLLLGKEIQPLVTAMKTHQKLKSLVLIISVSDETALGKLPSAILTPLFADLVKKDEKLELVQFCLETVQKKEDLGLYLKGDASPLVLAVKHRAIGAVALLTRIESDTASTQDFAAAWAIEEKKGLNELTFFDTQAAALPLDLRSTLRDLATLSVEPDHEADFMVVTDLSLGGGSEDLRRSQQSQQSKQA